MEKSKYQLSFYSNTTHVGIEKVGFHPNLLPFMQKAIDSILRQNKGGAKNATATIPFVIFPSVKKSLIRYNKIHHKDFMILYSNHVPIGVIDEDIPRAYPICPHCGKDLIKKVITIDPADNKWKRMVRWLTTHIIKININIPQFDVRDKAGKFYGDITGYKKGKFVAWEKEKFTRLVCRDHSVDKPKYIII